MTTPRRRPFPHPFPTPSIRKSGGGGCRLADFAAQPGVLEAPSFLAASVPAGARAFGDTRHARDRRSNVAFTRSLLAAICGRDRRRRFSPHFPVGARPRGRVAASLTSMAAYGALLRQRVRPPGPGTGTSILMPLDENFLLGAYIYDMSGFTAYKGASPLLVSRLIGRQLPAFWRGGLSCRDVPRAVSKGCRRRRFGPRRMRSQRARRLASRPIRQGSPGPHGSNIGRRANVIAFTHHQPCAQHRLSQPTQPPGRFFPAGERQHQDQHPAA